VASITITTKQDVTGGVDQTSAGTLRRKKKAKRRTGERADVDRGEMEFFIIV
jgi:hypothetical protein